MNCCLSRLIPILVLSLIPTVGTCNFVFADDSQVGQNPAYSVEVIEQTWTDAKRDRKVPVRLYLPKDLASAQPVVVMSPGLGSSREVYSYLGKHWAGQGYICVCVQHVGTDNALITGNNPLQLLRLLRAARNSSNWTNRAMDIQFVLDELEKRNTTDAMFKGKVDTKQCGVMGHSYGGFTALSVTGLKINFPDATEILLRDYRIKACLVCSPLPSVGKAFDEKSPQHLEAPCLYMHGTSDDKRAVTTKADERRFFFDNTTKSEAWIVSIEGAAQYAFTETDSLKGEKYDRDPRHHPWIQRISTAFWNAQLRNDEAETKWLNQDGFKQLVGKNASMAHKKN